MKKAIALLLALMTALSISVTAFAAETSGDAQMTYLEWAPGSTSGTPIVSIRQNDLLLVLGASNVPVLPETYLTPGEDYTFKIHRATADYTNVDPATIVTAPLTGADMGTAKLRVRNQKGSTGIASAQINEKGSGNARTFELKITAKENYGTKITDMEFAISHSGTAKVAINEGLATFKVGYRAMSDAEIESYGEGDIVTVPTATPVIKKKQFETLAKANDYKPVLFEGENGGWRFEGRVSGMGDTNFITSYDVVPDIINRYPDQDYKFLTFQGGVTFPTNGEMRIDVSDIVGDYDKMYTYLYRNGVLTPIATTYDNTSEEIVFRTNYLGAFMITDTEMNPGEFGNDVEPDVTEPTQPTTPTHPENPQTGASAVANVLVSLGAVALGLAGSVTRKKK